MYGGMKLSSISLALSHTVIHKAGITAKSKIKCFDSRHEEKLHKFHNLKYIEMILNITLKTQLMTFPRMSFRVMKS